jgi:rare lipoprotein A
MNRKLLSGFTATLLLVPFSAPSFGDAMSSEAVDQGAETSPKAASNQASIPVATLQQESPKVGEQQSQRGIVPNRVSTPVAASQPQVLKLGEQQSQTSSTSDGEVVAKVHSHELNGRQASTLYVRNIPVLTFIGSVRTGSADVKMGTQVPNSFTETLPSLTKSLTDPVELPLVQLTKPAQPLVKSATTETNTSAAQADPLWRAAEVAARLNQLHREGMDASKITVSWDTGSEKPSGENDFAGMLRDRYLIKVNNDILVAVDPNTVLPDSTRDLEQDALQATNRLRRLLGNAEPLGQVSGGPGSARQALALGSIRSQSNGWASWYGPGFHGNQSASGEIFDQNAMTAAHRTLPFGTQVLVTNLDNGQSVMVRINDRGPFYGNRIIDLSAAAARVLGLIHTGVAPVRLDVIDNRRATEN